MLQSAERGGGTRSNAEWQGGGGRQLCLWTYLGSEGREFSRIDGRGVLRHQVLRVPERDHCLLEGRWAAGHRKRERRRRKKKGRKDEHAEERTSDAKHARTEEKARAHGKRRDCACKCFKVLSNILQSTCGKSAPPVSSHGTIAGLGSVDRREELSLSSEPISKRRLRGQDCQPLHQIFAFTLTPLPLSREQHTLTACPPRCHSCPRYQIYPSQIAGSHEAKKISASILPSR